MKSIISVISLLICSLSLWAQPDAQPADQPAAQPLKPTDDPALLHKAAMDNLQMMSDKWAEIAKKPGTREAKHLFQRLSESYAAYKFTREETYIATQNQNPINYEKLREQQHKISIFEMEASALLGKDMPKLPPEVKPEAPPAPPVEPTPVPPKSYTTESGFEVRLQLEP